MLNYCADTSSLSNTPIVFDLFLSTFLNDLIGRNRSLLVLLYRAGFCVAFVSPFIEFPIVFSRCVCELYSLLFPIFALNL